MLPFIIPAVVCTSFALVASFATSVLLACVAAISSPFLITGALGTVAAVGTSFVLVFLAGAAAICTPLVLMAGFVVSVILACVAAICSAFLVVVGLAASHFFGFINLTPLILGLASITTRLTFPVAARAALIGASITEALAQSIRGEKECAQHRARSTTHGTHVL